MIALAFKVHVGYTIPRDIAFTGPVSLPAEALVPRPRRNGKVHTARTATLAEILAVHARVLPIDLSYLPIVGALC